MNKKREMPEVINIFWDNVEWHIEKKNLKWTDIFGGNASDYKGKRKNISLRKIQQVADALEIDDYAILFERVEDWMPNKLIYQVKIEEDIKIIELLLNRIYVVSRTEDMMIHEKLEELHKGIDDLKRLV